MKGSRILLTGPTSGIGQALARRLAASGCELVLAGRDVEETERVSRDVKLRYGSEVESRHFDAMDSIGCEALMDDLIGVGGLDGMILCHGYMVAQHEAEDDWSEARCMLEINYVSYVSLLSRAADHFRRQKYGFMCAVSSVAGDRGRQSNFLYGSAKGGVTVYLQGLRNAMQPHNVHVLTVKPGFVDTGMTWGLLEASSPLVASPDRVARDIVRALERRKDVLYTPWFWRWVMLIILSIPEGIFKRLRL